MAKVHKLPRLLFFIDGALPSDEHAEEARDLALEGFDVVYRNATRVEPDGSLEPFDEVAGSVPPTYAKERERKAEFVELNRPRFAPDGEEKPAKAPRKGREAPPVAEGAPSAPGPGWSPPNAPAPGWKANA